MGEQWTASMLAPLQARGWWVLHDRALPGGGKANADHIVISPGARVFVVDSKLWNARSVVHAPGGVLRHGVVDRSQSVRSLVFETVLVERAVGRPVLPVMAVHTAPVDKGGFYVPVDDPVVERVSVLPARDLVRALVLNDGPRDPGALWLAQAVAAKLPPYR